MREQSSAEENSRLHMVLRVFRTLMWLALSTLSHGNQLYFENLPDGIHNVLIGRRGGIYLTGFDSRRRVCLVLFAPPFGLPLRTVTELPYRDYGKSTPAVLAAHDPLRSDQIYVLLYLYPDNLGIEQTYLYRVELATSKLTLLAAATSPFWRPTAIIAHNDGSVIVSLGGLGPMLMYASCTDTACNSATVVDSNASHASGKGGMAMIDGMLCLVVDSELVFAEGGRLVCELPDGALHSIGTEVSLRATPDHVLSQVADSNGCRQSDGSSSPGGALANESNMLSTLYGIVNPSVLAATPSTSSWHALFVVSLERIDEYGYAQGSLHMLERQGSEESACCSLAGCWSEPRLVVRALSNPVGVAIDVATDTLYIVEQNTLRGFSYETFHGDVLAFCARGHYDCSSGVCMLRTHVLSGHAHHDMKPTCEFAFFC